jgi:hypothetical protein
LLLRWRQETIPDKRASHLALRRRTRNPDRTKKERKQAAPDAYKDKVKNLGFRIEGVKVRVELGVRG